MVRLLTLFSFNRYVVVDRRSRRVSVHTRHLWVFQRSRIVSFDAISRIVYRAQLMPDIGLLSWLPFVAQGGSAAFFIGVLLKDGRSELRLFTGWEQQPGEPDALDRLLGAGSNKVIVGDEEGARIVTLLREYLEVPISPA